MNTRIIDGMAISRRLRAAMADRVAALALRGRTPGLAVLIVGEDPASRVYVRNKVRACAELGIQSTHIELDASTSETELLAHVDRLNRNPAVHGILVQLPLPAHVSAEKVIRSVAPEKDVDGFHPINAGLLATGHPNLVPCTSAGVMAMLAAENVDPWAKHAVVIGASNIVGKPVAHLLLRKGATVTICNSKTPDLRAHAGIADILVVATGKPRMVTGEMVKAGAVVIDVGINRLPDGKLTGDCDFDSMLGKVGAISPVPGGVGPMTITMLLANTLQAAEAS